MEENAGNLCLRTTTMSFVNASCARHPDPMGTLLLLTSCRIIVITPQEPSEAHTSHPDPSTTLVGVPSAARLVRIYG